MRRLGRFLAPKQEKDQETDDNHQNAADGLIHHDCPAADLRTV
jgi:hypothetical protein